MSPTTVEALGNIALDRIGFPEQIGNIYEGTKQARALLNTYSETRDEVLRQKDWSFAFQQILASANGTPPQGWTYSWAYPADCVRVRDVLPAIGATDYDPQPLLWELYNSGLGKFILTQVTPIYVNYIARITDMTLWDAGFVEAMVQALAEKMAPLLREAQPMVNEQEALELAVTAAEPLAPTDPMRTPKGAEK